MATKKRKTNYAVREAHRKNLEQAKYRAQAAKRKAFWDKYQRYFIIGVPTLIVLIVGIWLVCKATVGPGGSIPNFFGNLQGVQENWIVTNQGTDRAPRYYKMGEFTAPEGYTLDPDNNISSDKLARNYFYKADDENAPIQSVYVSGIRSKTASEMIETVSGYNLYAEEATISEEPIGGMDTKWILGRINDDENATEESDFLIGHAQMNVYLDSVQGGSVLVYMVSKTSAPVEEIPTNDVFLAEAERIMAGLSVETAK